MSRASSLEPSPALTAQLRARLGPTARLPSALVADPPGCDQLAFGCAAGMMTDSLGSVVGASAEAPGAITLSRLPGRTTSFSPVTSSRSFEAELQPASTSPAAIIDTSQYLAIAISRAWRAGAASEARPSGWRARGG